MPLGQRPALAEAGWSTPKTESLPHSSAFANLQKSRLETTYYLDTYFHLDRRHSTLGYRSPR
jgi:putative transposase